MSDCAQSENYIKPDDVRFIVQADFNSRADMLSENRPQRHIFGVWRYVHEAIDRGATEVRIRPIPKPKSEEA